MHACAYTRTKYHTHVYTAGKPITAAHYRAGQVQVLTQATINPWILSGLLDVHPKRLTRLNVIAVASVMRLDNCAVFLLLQVNSQWPWEEQPASKFTQGLLCLELLRLVCNNWSRIKPNSLYLCLTASRFENWGEGCSVLWTGNRKKKTSENCLKQPPIKEGDWSEFADSDSIINLLI